MIKPITIFQIVFLEVCSKNNKQVKYVKKRYGFSSLGEVKLISTHPRMGYDYDIEEKMRKTLHFTYNMMYDKA